MASVEKSWRSPGSTSRDCCHCLAPPCRGELDRLANTRVGPTSTDISRHRRVNVGVTRLRRVREQRRGTHHLTRLAVATLDHFDFRPRPLYALTHRRPPHPLYRGHRSIAKRRD